MSDTLTSPEDSVRAAADAAVDVVSAAEESAIRFMRNIQERPMQSVAMAMAVGVLFGLCLRR